METADRNTLAKEIHDTAIFYGKYDLTADSITTLINILEKHYPEFFLEEFLQAYTDYKNDSKNAFFPSPSSLRKYLSPEVDDETVAISTAARVIEAVSKFGWSNSSDARAFVGELGWAGVCRFGGWSLICQELGVSINVGTFQAQLKAIIKSEVVISKAGGLPALDYHKRDPDMQISDKRNAQVFQLVQSLGKEVPK